MRECTGSVALQAAICAWIRVRRLRRQALATRLPLAVPLLAILVSTGCYGKEEEFSLFADFRVEPQPAAAGQLVNFDGSYSDAAVTYWSWDFGDGEVVSDVVSMAQHAYDVPGTYDVRLTVTDANGEEATTTLTITVVAITLTIEFDDDASGGVQIFIDGVDYGYCIPASGACIVETHLGAFVEIVPDGNIDGWDNCDDDLGVGGCSLTMNSHRTVIALVRGST